jgi:hypothetical protein
MVRRTILAALALSIASSAQATPSVSTPVIPSSIAGADHVACEALNTGTKAADVTVEIVNANTGAQLGLAAGLLPPSIRKTASISASGLFTKFCRVTGLSKSKVTISFTEFDASNTPLLSVTAP